MTSTRKQRRKGIRATVTLTRRNIENILVWQMGWEHIDVEAFWRLARKLKYAGL